MRIAVIDGQGGGIGKSIIEQIRKALKDDMEIIALGTNSQATSNMLRGGAHQGATGENAIMVSSQKVDLIVGPLAIILADSMLGEISANIANAIARSPAKKVLLPMDRCGVTVTGIKSKGINELIGEVVYEIQKEIKNREG